jgi:hypothetical protein
MIRLPRCTGDGQHYDQSISPSDGCVRRSRGLSVMFRELTSKNFFTLLTTSLTNFILEIDRRFVAKSAVWICVVDEVDEDETNLQNLPSTAKVNTQQARGEG